MSKVVLDPPGKGDGFEFRWWSLIVNPLKMTSFQSIVVLLLGMPRSEILPPWFMDLHNEIDNDESSYKALWEFNSTTSMHAELLRSDLRFRTKGCFKPDF